MKFRDWLRWAAASLFAAITCIAAYRSLGFGLADWHGRRLDFAAARRLAPGDARYATTPEEAVRLNPYSARDWMRLGLERESLGDLDEAVRCLKEAARVDRTFEPRWALANFHFRRRNEEEFWKWSREAAGIGYGDLSALFDLCWRFTDRPELILSSAIPERPEVLAAYLGYLLQRNRVQAAGPVAVLVSPQARRPHLPLLLHYCDKAIEAGDTSSAVRVWNSMAGRRLIAVGGLAPDAGESLTNGDCQSAPLGHGFDWRPRVHEGVSMSRTGNPPAFRFSLSGRQPEACGLMAQTAPVIEGRRYRLRYLYRTAGLQPETGLSWRTDAASGTAARLAASAEWREGALEFTPRKSTVLLELVYARPLGQPRTEASVEIRALRLGFKP